MKINKIYFLAPTRHTPPDGPIALGNIIKDPRSPEITLNNANSEAVLKLAAKHIDVDESHSSKYLTQETFFRGEIFAKFLAGFNLGTGAKWGNDASTAYRFDKLTTQSIYPSLSDIKEIFNEPAVQENIKDSRFRDNVYMITGVQIAYGADFIASTIREQGGFLHFRADLTPTDAPVNVGATAEASNQHGQMLSSHISEKTPFVLAYRLREIIYRRAAVREHKDVNNGDLMGIEGGKGDPETEGDPSNYTADLYSLKDEDPELPEMWELISAYAIDMDGTECRVVDT
ncbi:hypothetical protein LHYA1_G001226 [Lachnellula hyalina]|uniref:Uncharacterized protein n=1 Tax=Lachnellula hyalina TaxID=1316788 RepID=A0A8H8U4X0_9HELO|nr:uncharacterized protein LHYA1_G001226 [Lachnellula hyalina]TVY30643.1 hypothetical protein LHYA1_G001226 [Lachnellula hyalina]